MQDADFDPPPSARPGKATHAAPDPKATHAKSASVDKKSLPTESSKTIDGENMLVLLGAAKPIDVLTDEKKRDQLYALIRKEISEQKPDLSTQAGRDRVKSFVFKITRTRTALDAAGKEKTADMRKAVDAVNALRNDANAALQTLEAEARRPLTEWEAAEALKAQTRREILDDISRAVQWSNRENPPIRAEECRELVAMIEGQEIDPDLWGDDLAMITDRKAEVVGMLKAKTEAAELREKLAASEAEAAKLRAQQAATTSKTEAVEQSKLDRGRETYEEGTARQILEEGNIAPRASGAPPAAGSAPSELSPTQKARRVALPALLNLGLSEQHAKALILAVERGEIPGITATYLEQAE